jgi:hypothetical protein
MRPLIEESAPQKEISHVLDVARNEGTPLRVQQSEFDVLAALTVAHAICDSAASAINCHETLHLRNGDCSSQDG